MKGSARSTNSTARNLDSEFDKLGIGALSEKELDFLSKNTRTKMSNQEFQDVASYLDKMNHNPRDFNEFFIDIAKSKKDKSILNKTFEAFKVFDGENKGTVSIDLIRNLLRNFGERLDPAEIDEILANLDDVKDNEVDYQNLLNNIFKGF